MDFSVPKVISVNIELNPLEFKKISVELLSTSMEEKWNNTVENNILTCSRSWTGNPIYQAEIIHSKNDTYRIVEIKAETDKEIYRVSTDEEIISSFKSHISYLAKREIRNSIEDLLLGFITGDALGVPVEFKTREFLKNNPVKDMIGNGTYNQPKGTWSDDSTMTLCLAETLLDSEFDLSKLANRFINWVDHGYWTPHGKLFDIGNTTRIAIERLRIIDDPLKAGGCNVNDNGNGALMRVLPLIFELYYIKDKVQQYELIRDVTSLTHGHERSVLACFYYLTYASFQRSRSSTPMEMYRYTNTIFERLIQELSIDQEEVMHFGRLLSNSIQDLEESEIKSSGYVIDTLEASMWCLLTTNTYKDAVLTAVNLGGDTDTIAAITGGIAGLRYGKSKIPEEWINSLAKLNDIDLLIDRLSDKYGEARC